MSVVSCGVVRYRVLPGVKRITWRDPVNGGYREITGRVTEAGPLAVVVPLGGGQGRAIDVALIVKRERMLDDVLDVGVPAKVEDWQVDWSPETGSTAVCPSCGSDECRLHYDGTVHLPRWACDACRFEEAP